ncbi:hypothetical protein ACFQO9_08910 [Chryseobacterium zhengzhouense]|uniref:DUF1735 domain-containing protein n=1 Tax=Chryseobacterium zhengzhouense TaxID=1636086 RepID=A0ABW2LWA9_9FLAO
MRKFFPILMLAFVSFFTYSCDNNDDVIVDNTQPYEYPQMKDFTGSLNSSNNFTLSVPINIPATDVVLVYRNVGSGSGTNAVWQLIPKTYYLDDNISFPADRELDYNFDFTTLDVEITSRANFNQATQMTAAETNMYLNNQIFRVVLIPTVAGKNANAVDHSDYNAVIKYYNLNDQNVPSTKVN